MRTDRYGEVMLVTLTDDGEVVADVFNTYPFNDCPAELWEQLDPGKIAADAGVTAALLNGPRYWLIDGVEPPGGEPEMRDFGGITMAKRATLELGPLSEAGTPYVVHAVNRRTVFMFSAGHAVYELTDPDGTRYVMQSWSQQVDPGLVEDDLAGLGARLTLPAGWRFSTRTLDEDLRVVTQEEDARVLQDDLKNSYSQLPA
jgi:hypothetical protein